MWLSEPFPVWPATLDNSFLGYVFFGTPIRTEGIAEITQNVITMNFIIYLPRLKTISKGIGKIKKKYGTNRNVANDFFSLGMCFILLSIA